jgi:transcription initiation factor TFIID subunit 2
MATLDEHLPPEELDEALQPIKDEPPYDFAVVKQDVELEVNFRDRRIDGRSQIFIASFDDKLDEVAIDARQCEIDVGNVTIETMKPATEGFGPEEPPRKVFATYKDPYRLLDYPKYYNWGAEHHDLRKMRMRPLTHVRESDLPADARDSLGCTPVDGSLRVKLKPNEVNAEPAPGIPRRPTVKFTRTSTSGLGASQPPAAADGERKVRAQYRITIPFSTPRVRDGLQFVGVEEGDRRYPHVYTRHSIEPGTASCIFPCIDDHGSRCDWKISIKCPRTLGDALRQALATQQLPNGHANGLAPNNIKSRQQPLSPDHSLTEEDKLLEMTVVCSGLLTDEIVDPGNDRKKIMTFEPENKVSVQKLGFAVGPFEHVDLWSEFRLEEDDEKLGASALKVHGYCLPGRADEVRNTCAAMALAADFFALTFSSYPFDSFKFCFVDDMISDTVPLYSFAFLSNRLLYPVGIIDTEIETTRKIIHTLATQWSGINIIPNTRRDTWVVAGIAYFMTDLFMKKLCGNNDYRFRMKTMSDRLVKVDVDRPSLYELGQHLHVGDFEVEFMALKAPIVLFILDKRLVKASGSTGLIRIISRLFSKSRTSGRDSDCIVNTESFRKMCEKNGKLKLESFWQQWIYGSSCPQFDVSQRFNKKRLCVEMIIKQVQLHHDGQGGEEFLGDTGPGLKKSEFLRLIKEAQHGVRGGKIQSLFTGPMTIRIHEADGTPYEHIVEIREDNIKGAKFDIPYNTKYKRLKRNRRQRERQNANAGANADVNAENDDDVLLYCLGDVLQSKEEVAEWDLRDWPPELEKSMDQESYEWIRIDSDFEWACSLRTNLKNYMYVSQLQQDRDVVAQQDTLLFLAQQGMKNPHPLGSTFLIRTLMDRRYFHGVRTMAAEILPYNATEVVNMIGFTHLQKAFQELFCYPGTIHPRPNDFSDKRQYQVQCAIPLAIARVRDRRGQCPKAARQFILDQLRFNNNNNNIYSDHFYIARLLEALATSLIPEKRHDGGDAPQTFSDEDKITDEKALLPEATKEIDRWRDADAWNNSYHNIWTITALDCKQRLMKAGMIEPDPVEFVRYLQDENYDEVRIKAFEALVDLGLMMELPIFKLLLFCMSTDKSPYVRDRLLKVFATGLAALAFGEIPRPEAPPVDIKNEDDDGDLMVLEADKFVESRRIEIERRRDLKTALAALKKEMEEVYKEHEQELQETLWSAIDSTILGRAEKITLVELCGTIFDESDSWVISLKYPKRWKITRHINNHRERRVSLGSIIISVEGTDTS